MAPMPDRDQMAQTPDRGAKQAQMTSTPDREREAQVPAGGVGEAVTRWSRGGHEVGGEEGGLLQEAARHYRAALLADPRCPPPSTAVERTRHM